MNTKKSFALAGTGVFLIFLATVGRSQTYYKDLKYPKLHELKMPDVERVELDNGMIVFLLEDHELPLIQMNAQIGVGSIDDPADKLGLAMTVGQVMRTGGTATMSGDKMDEALEQIAASVETRIGLTSGSASLSVLKEHLDQGLAILADVLRHPAFPEDKIELSKIQSRSGIARRNDNPSSINFREYSKLIYGANSPYARQMEYDTINAITREDLMAFHKKFYHPNNILLAAWGDFDRAALLNKLRQAFAEWPRASFQRPKLPGVNYQFDASVNLVKKEDINQTYVLMGHIGDLMNNPDYPSLIVMNNILGGMFSSRMFARIRSRMGLTYSPIAYYTANYDSPGLFYVGCQTKSESTLLAINAMKEEVERMTSELPTEDELKKSKEYYLNTYVFNFEDKGSIISRLMTYEFYGYPKDFLQKERQGVENTSREDVLRVAKKYLHPDQLRVLAVGNPAKFDQLLSTLGTVREIDITIREQKKVSP
jgi:predicted Zn-dependent peptidase